MQKDLWTDLLTVVSMATDLPHPRAHLPPPPLPPAAQPCHVLKRKVSAGACGDEVQAWLVLCSRYLEIM